MGQSLQRYKTAIESSLRVCLPQSGLSGGKNLDEALWAAVFPGGKRLRPILSILGAEVFTDDIGQALPAACAVEFVHTSSLIFDDLPCMDDAAVRRGSLALHRLFGEDVAMLAGLALLNQSYAIFGRTPILIGEATRCIGIDGMIVGQVLDVSPSPNEGDDYVRRLTERNRKTSAMMRLATTAGALASGVSLAEVTPLGDAGQLLGEAYQVADDLIDVLCSTEQSGKTTRQDRRHGRPSHQTHDLSACLARATDLVEQSHIVLTDAYDAPRISGLLNLIDHTFAGLLAEATSAC